MKRRIVIDIDQDVVDYLTNRPGSNTASALLMSSRLVGAARAALGPQPDPCPTCDGPGCNRCYNTGRQVLCKIAIAPTTAGRATVDIWQGAPGTMQLVATTTRDQDRADVTIDAMLACLRDGGLIIDDRRGR